MKTKTHTRYRLSDGTIVPGVTTILGVLAKPALIHWAWKMGSQGIDYRKYRDDKAGIGTLAHAMVEAHLKREPVDTSDYSVNQIEQAKRSLDSYFAWEADHPFEPFLLEKPLVSETWGFGGTADIVGKNGKTILIDLKTGKAIYPEMKVQVAAYKELLHENGYDIDEVRILRIGRDDSEGFEDQVITRTDEYWKIFSRCLEIYNLKKLLSGRERRTHDSHRHGHRSQDQKLARALC